MAKNVQFLTIFVIFVLLFVGSFATKSNLKFSVDFNSHRTAWPHYWENSVGSSHATLSLRADWREHMHRAHDELGFQRVRFHGIFDDDMSTFPSISSPSFFNIDSSYRYLLSIGMRPLVEISFMPERMASKDTHIFHYNGNTSPPRNMSDWEAAVRSFAQHLVDAFGIEEVSTWIMEIWNEPNIDFWSGTQQQYFDLYEKTARAIKSVSPKLRVGGPVSSNSSWLPDFMQFIKNSNVPCDFISSHQYPTDRQPLAVDVLPKVVAEDAAVAAPLPFFLTEYNDGLGIGQHDEPYAAAFVVRNVAAVQGLCDIFSFWCVSDIFEEQGQDPRPFQDNFGLLTIYGVPKPSYRAFELLHGSGSLQIPVDGVDINAASLGIVVTVESSDKFPSKDGEERYIHFIIWNHDVVQNPPPEQTAQISITNLPTDSTPSATVARIDDSHANAKATWLAQGSPVYPTEAQVNAMHKSSELVEEEVKVVKSGDSVQFEVVMPPQSVARVVLRY